MSDLRSARVRRSAARAEPHSRANDGSRPNHDVRSDVRGRIDGSRGLRYRLSDGWRDAPAPPDRVTLSARAKAARGITARITVCASGRGYAGGTIRQAGDRSAAAAAFADATNASWPAVALSSGAACCISMPPSPSYAMPSRRARSSILTNSVSQGSLGH